METSKNTNTPVEPSQSHPDPGETPKPPPSSLAERLRSQVAAIGQAASPKALAQALEGLKAELARPAADRKKALSDTVERAKSTAQKTQQQLVTAVTQLKERVRQGLPSASQLNALTARVRRPGQAHRGAGTKDPRSRQKPPGRTVAVGPGAVRIANSPRSGRGEAFQTMSSASATMARDILDWPTRRSSNTMGSSTSLSPARWARYFISI